MNTKFFIDKAFDASLETIFETIFTGGNAIINSAASEILVGKEHGVHFGMDGKIVFHGALRESHFRLVGTLKHAVITERHDAFVSVYNHTAHLRRRVFAFSRDRLGDAHKIFIPFRLFTHNYYLL